MQIRMLNPPEGTRADGTPWPRRGGVIDVPDDEGENLVATGRASRVADEGGPLPPAPDDSAARAAAADSEAAQLRAQADLRAAEAAEARIAAHQGRDAEDEQVRVTAEAAAEADKKATEAERAAAAAHRKTSGSGEKPARA
jgi:hypothetical protein